MSNDQQLSLALFKRSSVLDGMTMLEIVPLKRIKALLASNLLLVSWEWDNYPNEIEQIKAYLSKYNKHLGGVQVKYVKAKHKWGRPFPLKSLGLTTIRRECRNALISGLYYDLDLKNAQPNIIRNLCESNRIPCPIISRYCENRDEFLKQVQDAYSVGRSEAKDLFIRLCFKGTYDGWCFDNKIADRPPLEFITLYERELSDIANKAKEVNPVLFETARKAKEDKGEKKPNRIMGSFFGLYNQEYETRIVETVLCYIMNHTSLMKIDGVKTPVGTYEYDGIKLLKSNVDTFSYCWVPIRMIF
jgi:hypothetical protein